MEELLAALEEWRASRQAIFDKRVEAGSEAWARLANAEHRLMNIARNVPVAQE